jgi:hypothetical protein
VLVYYSAFVQLNAEEVNRKELLPPRYKERLAAIPEWSWSGTLEAPL